MSRNPIGISAARGILEQLESRRLYSTGPMNFDLNRDGEISGDDFFIVDSNAGHEVQGWASGDINNDGMCDDTDKALLTSAFEAANAGGETVVTDAGPQRLILAWGDANGDGLVNEVDAYDMNYDGVVDDLERWEASQGLSPRKGGWSEGDFNGDGMVDQADVIIFNPSVEGDPEANPTIGGEPYKEVPVRFDI